MIKKIILTVVFLGALGSAVFQVAASPRFSASPEEVQSVENAVNEAFKALSKASRACDLSQLDETMVDTADYHPTQRTKEFVARVFGQDVADRAGYLTTMKAKFVAQCKSQALLDKALKKAKAENRKINNNDLEIIANESYGVVPHAPKPTTTVTIDPKKVTEFGEVNFADDGNKATVLYSTINSKDKAVLVKVNGKWYVSSIEILYAGF